MKTVRIIKYAVLAMVLFVGCSKENESSLVPEEDLQTYTQEIPVTFEGMEDTKMTLDGETGVCAWSDYDALAIDTSTGWYYAPVVGGSVRLNLASGQTRRRFAGYPGFDPYNHTNTNPISSADTDPTVYYRSSASYSGRTNDWMWAPMIAENTGETLKFFHVGGVVRITVNNLPSNYISMTVYFYGKRVTGNYTVTNAGTANATTEAETITGSSSVNLSYLTNTAGTIYANIPIPAGDYSALTQIRVSINATYGYEQSIYFPNGWGEIKRGEGRKLTFDMSGEVSGGDGTIHPSYHYKPHFLKWNATESKYEIFDDPLELMLHSTSSDIDVYYHRIIHSGTSSPSGNYLKTLRYRVLGDVISYTIPSIPIDGRYYHILYGSYSNTTSETYRFLSGNTNNAKINGNTYGKAWLKISVDLSDATPENGAAQDYRNKGTHSSRTSYSISSGQPYVNGVLLLSNDINIKHTSFFPSNYGIPSGTIPYTFLKKLLDAGCFFIPSVGCWNDQSSPTRVIQEACIGVDYGWSTGSNYTYSYISYNNSTEWTTSSVNTNYVLNHTYPIIVLEGQKP